MHFSLLTVCGLLTAAIAAPTTNSRRRAVHERRERLPAHWKRNAKLDGDSHLPLRIALTQSNLDKADEFLMDVSHPESPNYGKYWSAKQVAQTFAPSQESFTLVLEWLVEHGIPGDRVKQSQSLNWMHVDVTVSEAEGLLNTQYFEYKHAMTGQSHVACEEYSLPEDIKQHIDFVTPTVHFDAKVENPKKRRSLNENEIAIAKRQTSATGHNVQPGIGHTIGSPGDKSLPKNGGKVSWETVINELENCDVSIVPDCLRALYEFPPNFPANAKSKSDHFRSIEL
jgi:tripeptidyl-peptidase-1